MIKHHNYVLKRLRKLSGKSDATIEYVGYESTFYLSNDPDKKCHCPKYESELDSTLEALKVSGYIKFVNSQYTLALTSKGLHPYRYGWETVKAFLLKSVLVPIVVSFITTLLINLVRFLPWFS